MSRIFEGRQTHFEFFKPKTTRLEAIQRGEIPDEYRGDLTVYLLHFRRPIGSEKHSARHYVGVCHDLRQRLKQQRTFSRVVDGLLLVLLLTAILLILTGHAQASPFDFLNPSKAAAKINQIENALYFAAGIASALAVVYVLRVVFRFVASHWKLFLGLAGIVLTIAALLSL